MGIAGITLVMDAAAGNGTIAVLRDGAVVAEADVVMRSEQEERFFPAVLDSLARAGTTLDDLQQLIVGAGPGSFTALRVVGAIAKGISLGRGIALYAVPSLALVAVSDARQYASSSRWLVTLDALRGERYAALVSRAAGGEVLSVKHLGVIATSALENRAAELAATLIGPDEALVARPHARNVTHSLALVQAAGPVDLVSWEPLYGRLAEAQVKWEAAHGRPLA